MFGKTELIRKYIEKQKKHLLEAIADAKEARNSSPSAMESHSDTGRYQNDKLIIALEEQLVGITRYEKDISSLKLIYIEVKTSDLVKKFLLTPQGLGGDEIDGVRLLSSDTPLGTLLNGKKQGDKFEFNNQSFEILRVE